MAFLADFTVINKRGNINGKPNTGISRWLLPAPEAIAETMVKTVESPIVNKTETIRYCQGVCILKPRTNEYAPTNSNNNKRDTRELKIILESISASGLQIEW